MYKIPVAAYIDCNRDKSTGRCQQSRDILYMKVAAAFGLVLLMASLVILIGLHFQQQSEWKKGVDVLKREIALLKGLFTWYRASNGKFYKVFQELVNFTTAIKRCVEEDGHLVTEGIRNAETRSELENLIKANGQNTWIGLDDIKNEGDWRWIDNVVADMKQINWLRNQPDNRGNEDCGHYWKKYGWYVNDTPCYTRMYFLCEKQ